MKFSLTKEQLLPLLSRVNSIIEGKSTTKVRTHILINAYEDRVELIGFDNEMKISGNIAVMVEETGQITVNSQKFFDIVRSLRNGAEILIHLVDNQLNILSGSSKFHLATIPAEDYPLPDSYDFDQTLSLPANQLVDLMNLVKFSMASNDVRHYLNGLLLHFTDSDVVAVTTDGHRLSVAEIPNTFGIAEQKRILPRKAVGEVTSWLAGQTDALQINLSETHIQFVFGSMEMTSTLINAEYPAYETVIPELSSNLIVVPNEAMKEALERAKILSSEYGLGVSLSFAAWKLALSAKNMDNESVEDSIDINYDGEQIKTAFNINYLKDIFSHIANENVTLSLQDGQSSCLIYDADKENSRYIVMPMNI